MLDEIHDGRRGYPRAASSTHELVGARLLDRATELTPHCISRRTASCFRAPRR